MASFLTKKVKWYVTYVSIGNKCESALGDFHTVFVLMHKDKGLSINYHNICYVS